MLPFEQVQVPAWHTDIETHFNVQNAQYQQCLRDHCSTKFPSHAKKPFITEEIWAIRDAKQLVRKRCKKIGQFQRLQALRMVFQIWTLEAADAQSFFADYFHYSTTVMCWKLPRVAQLSLLARQLKRRLRTARQVALTSDLIALPEDTPAHVILKAVKSHVGSTNAKTMKRKTLPMLLDVDGEPCAHPAQLLGRWIDFFKDVEGGARIDDSDQRALWRNNLEKFAQQELSLEPSDVPSLTDLELALRRVQRHKATGPDGLPSELCAACPARLARQLYGALLKLVLHGQECLLHKGGALIPVFKGKGSPLDASSYRSLLVSCHIGKALHRTVRQTQATLLEAYMCSQQLGGRRHVPVTLGLHEARAFLRGGQKDHSSVALLMVDLTEAFYRVLRPLSVGCQFHDQEIAMLATRLNLGPDVLHQLHLHLQEPSAIQQAGMPLHYRRVLEALHTDTHFKLPGQLDRCRTTIGSRPGDSFADVVFSFLFSRVLQCFDLKLQQHGLQHRIERHDGFAPFATDRPTTGQDMAYMGPVWMDDLCVCFSDGNPQAVINKATVATSLLLETFQEHAMTPNLKPGKTKLLVSLRGSGVRAWKTRLFGPQSSHRLPIVTEHHTYELSVVGQYQHLGGIIHHGGDHRVEVRRRVAMAHQSFNSLRKAIFHNEAISLTKRVQLFESLILAKLLYGCESWVLRTWAHKEFLHAAIMKLYRRVLRLRHDAPVSDEQVCVRLAMPLPVELLRRARLRYLGTLHRCHSTVTWSILHADDEWCALVRDDLQWMWRQLAAGVSLPDPTVSFEPWRYLWLYHGGYWKGLIKRACAHSALQRANTLLVREAHADILHDLCSVGHIECPAFPVPPPSRPTHAQFGCMFCAQAFRSHAGEGAHMFRKHRIISPLRWLFDGTSCPACLREYHSAGRLKAHLRHNAQCRGTLQNRPALSAPGAGIGSQCDARRVQREGGLLPPLAGAGPLPAPGPRRGV